jgi:hypothetical protein
MVGILVNIEFKRMLRKIGAAAKRFSNYVYTKSLIEE